MSKAKMKAGLELEDGDFTRRLENDAKQVQEFTGEVVDAAKQAEEKMART